MHIALRPWRPEDAAALASLLNNPHILKNLRDGIPYPYTKSDAAAYIQAMLQADPHSTFTYAVCADGTLVGSISAFRQPGAGFRTAELGYYLDEAYWGRGIMTEAVKVLCRRLFAETDLVRIYAEVFSENIGSRRVLEKAGFTCEGILKCQTVKDGAVLDTALYARIRRSGK